ncbi:putative HTH-type transcriptional regulator [compost metagenome]
MVCDFMKDLQEYVIDLPLHNLVFFTLVETTAKLVDVSEKYWQSKGLNGARIRILVEIMKEGGTLLPSTLAKKIGVTKSNISLLLSPLENEGYIRREPHPEDGRKWVISITREGQNLLLQYLPENRQGITEKMQVLEDQELTQLLALLNKLKKGKDDI